MIVLLFFALLWMVDGVFSQLHYTVQEEQEHGTFVGNIAEDLGLDITKLSARRFQTVANSRTPYLDLNLETGVLYVNEKIDREQICKQSPSCVLHLEVFLENPLELFRVEIEVLDINDNPPSFSTFGKEKALHGTLERKELDGLLSNTRAPYKPPYLNHFHPLSCFAHWK